MTTMLKRWMPTLGWLLLMWIVWTLLVPGRVSVTTFVLLGLTGLAGAVLGPILWNDTRPPHSVGDTLADLESATPIQRPTPAAPRN